MDRPKRSLNDAKPFNSYSSYALGGIELNHVASVMHRLYSERRLDGDDMRDLAHALYCVLSSAMDMEDGK